MKGMRIVSGHMRARAANNLVIAPIPYWTNVEAWLYLLEDAEHVVHGIVAIPPEVAGAPYRGRTRCLRSNWGQVEPLFARLRSLDTIVTCFECAAFREVK